MGYAPSLVKKPRRALSAEAKCPACTEIIKGDMESLRLHFEALHQRSPSEGEKYQFRSYKRKNFTPAKYTVGYFKNPREVSGGLPSLGKRK